MLLMTFTNSMDDVDRDVETIIHVDSHSLIYAPPKDEKIVLKR